MELKGERAAGSIGMTRIGSRPLASAIWNFDCIKPARMTPRSEDRAFREGGMIKFASLDCGVVGRGDPHRRLDARVAVQEPEFLSAKLAP